MKDENKGHGLLDDIKVLDMTEGAAGFCSKLLADMGAQVIKIEKPSGDPSRKNGPFIQDPPDPEKSLSFHYHNTNKLGITLDLETGEGKSIFLRLLRKIGIIVETFPAGYMENIGLGFDNLRKANSKLILISITGFGRNGPRSAYKACDLAASAFGGHMHMSGASSTPPLKASGEQSFYASSLFAAIGILLAVRRQRETGQGEHLDLSLQEATTATLEHVMVRYFADGINPKRQGSLHWNNEFIILPCDDGFIHLTLFQQWGTLTEWMSREGMAEDLMDEKWLDDAYRRKHSHHIIQVLERWTQTHTVSELFELGQLMRFPWAPVQSPMDLIHCPQLGARDFFVPAHPPETSAEVKVPSRPFRMKPKNTFPQRGAPRVGQDNFRIYCEELGISEQELASLVSKKVI